MRDGAPDEVLAGACTWQARVTSWLGGRMLAERIPIASGRITGDVGNDVIESLSITVPRWAAPAVGTDVVDWRPSATDHPLARYGQILDVTIVVSSVITGQVWETRIGRYQIKDWSDDDAGMISVKGESLLARTRDDKLKALSSSTGTLTSEARRLLPAGMGASFDSDLVDRPVPESMSWAKDRLKNLKEIADAWPALLRIDQWGQVRFRAPLPAVPVPVLTLRDGKGGTLISAPRNDTRTGVYNEVIASTQGASQADVQGYAAITGGPMSINGEYTPVTKEWSSSLLENQAQADAAAATMLANSTRPALAIPARIAPDPRIELDDPVAVLRGARGRMQRVDATYANWTEQRRNLLIRPLHSLSVTGWTGAGVAWASVAGGMRTSAASALADSAVLYQTPAMAVGAIAVGSARFRVFVDPSSAPVTLRAQIFWGPQGTQGAPVTIGPGETADVVVENDLVPVGATVFRPTLRTVPAHPAGFTITVLDGTTFEEASSAGDVMIPGEGDSDTRRTRWLGAENGSQSVVDAREVLVPEHRRWVTETVDESADVDRQWGWVTAYDLPLTVSDGDMRIDVGLPS